MNLNQLDKRIKELGTSTVDSFKKFEETAKDTGKLADSIGEGIAIGQMVFNLFNLFERYNLPPKKRINRMLISIALIAGFKYLQHYLNETLSDEEGKDPKEGIDQ